MFGLAQRRDRSNAGEGKAKGCQKEKKGGSED